jgi:hypothetical protein
VGALLDQLLEENNMTEWLLSGLAAAAIIGLAFWLELKLGCDGESR